LRRLIAGQQGFSLIEALVAASLLGIIAMGFAVGADRAVRFNVYSRSVTAATTLAQAKVEELASKVSTDAQLTSGPHADAANPLTAHGTAGGIYTRTWSVTNNVPAAGLKTVQVTVTWSLYAKAHTVNLVMVKS
jgi:prepilin-type N-terminal cleavage/methylation domain-containing protein